MFNENSSPTVTNCTFSGNTASIGGGMCNEGSSPTVTNCTFSGNSALDFGVGGGMANFEGSPTVTNCTFSMNSASVSGGGIYNGGGSPTVTDGSFCGNSPDHLAPDLNGLSGQFQMTTFCPIPVCPGDINGDGEVGINDFLDLLAAWGPCK